VAKAKAERRILTANAYGGVPKRKVLVLTSTVKAHQKWQVTTNCDVDESPLWHMRSLQDRVWRTVANYAANASASKNLWQPETHILGAE
jgi:hypothetical protein